MAHEKRSEPVALCPADYSFLPKHAILSVRVGLEQWLNVGSTYAADLIK